MDKVLMGVVGFISGSLLVFLFKKKKNKVTPPVASIRTIKQDFTIEKPKDELKESIEKEVNEGALLYESDVLKVFKGEHIYLPGHLDLDVLYLDYSPRTGVLQMGRQVLERDMAIDLFGEQFVRTVLPMGIIDGEILTCFVGNYKLVVSYLQDNGIEEVPYMVEDLHYDPDSSDFYETDDIEDEIDMIEDMLDDDLDDLIFDQGPFFTPEGITFSETGELTQEQWDSGWDVVGWTYKSKTGFLYDERDDFIEEIDVMTWLGEDILLEIIKPDILQKYPDKIVYVRNGNLKMLYHIHLT